MKPEICLEGYVVEKQGMESMANNQQNIRDYFSRSVEYWNEIYTGKKFIKLHMEDRRQKVIRLLEKHSNGRMLKILDLGCGSGLLTKPIARRGHIVISMDCSIEMLRKLKTSYDGREMGNPCQVILGDGEKGCFKAGSFDVVVCIGVLQYQVEEDPLIAEVSRILCSGGIGIISAPNLLRMNYVLDPSSYLRFLLRIVGSLSGLRSEKKDWTKCVSGISSTIGPADRKFVLWQLNKAIERNGLCIKEIVGFGFGPLTLMGKQVIADESSWKLSEMVGRLSRRAQFIKLLANRWLFVIEK